MPEFGVEDLERLHERISELSERHAANARSLLKEIEQRRREAREQDQNFVVPSAAQLVDMLQTADNPRFGSQSWTSITTSPGLITLTAGVFNPTPNSHSGLFVHVFIGPANPVANVGQALALVDTRFPRLTQPDFDGFTLPPSASATMHFSMAVPPNIEPSTYMGNFFLFQSRVLQGTGKYLDRTFFGFEVT